MTKLFLLSYEIVSEKPTIIELEDGNSLSFVNRIHQIAIDPTKEEIEGLNFRFAKPQIIVFENNLETYVEPNDSNLWGPEKFKASDMSEENSVDFVVDQNFSYYEVSIQGDKSLIILSSEIETVHKTGFYKEDGEPVYWVRHASNLSVIPLTGDDLNYFNANELSTNQRRKIRRK